MNRIATIVLVTSCWIGLTVAAYASGTSSGSSSWGSSSSSSGSGGSGETTPGTSTHSDGGIWDQSSGDNKAPVKRPAPSQDIWNEKTQNRDDSSRTHAISLYDQGMVASKSQDYQKALDLFQQALTEDPNNPDILNMLAHTQRLLGNTDEALANYKRALELRPKFPEAREYLGEAYMQAALQQLQTLKSYGGEADENVDDLTKAIKDAAGKL